MSKHMLVKETFDYRKNKVVVGDEYIEYFKSPANDSSSKLFELFNIFLSEHEESFISDIVSHYSYITNNLNVMCSNIKHNHKSKLEVFTDMLLYGGIDKLDISIDVYKEGESQRSYVIKLAQSPLLKWVLFINAVDDNNKPSLRTLATCSMRDTLLEEIHSRVSNNVVNCDELMEYIS